MDCKPPETKDEIKWALDSGLVSEREWRMNGALMRAQNLVRMRVRTHSLPVCQTCLRFVSGHD